MAFRLRDGRARAESIYSESSRVGNSCPEEDQFKFASLD